MSKNRGEKITLGAAADSLLGSDTFNMVLEDLLYANYTSFLATSSHQHEEREKLYDFATALRLVKGRLEVLREDGKIELHNQKLDDEALK